jgi:TnpA family transposase
VNIKRPAQHWDEILRLIASMMAGVAKPSLVLKCLSAFERKNNLSSAIQDVGQIDLPQHVQHNGKPIIATIGVA